MHNQLENNPHESGPNQGMTPAKWALVGVAAIIGIATIVGGGFYIGKKVAERDTVTTKKEGKTITPKKTVQEDPELGFPVVGEPLGSYKFKVCKQLPDNNTVYAVTSRFAQHEPFHVIYDEHSNQLQIDEEFYPITRFHGDESASIVDCKLTTEKYFLSVVDAELPEIQVRTSKPEPSEPEDEKKNSEQVVTEVHGAKIQLEDITWQDRTEVEQSLVLNNPEHYTAYKVGMVNSGEFAGYELHYTNVPCECMIGYPPWVMLKKGDELRVLKEYSVDSGPDFAYNDRFNSYILDHRLTISDLVAPYSIELPDLNTTLKQERVRLSDHNTEILFDAANMELWRPHPEVGNIYVEKTHRTGAFILKMPDGTVAEYSYQIPFQKADTTSVSFGEVQNFVAYEHGSVGGCGWMGYADVVKADEVSIPKDLKKIGEINSGIATEITQRNILGYNDPQHPQLQELYGNRSGFAEITTGKELSYEEYLALNPVFFWVDPFGRLTRFIHPALQVMAECGKPVIYLYPKETTDVSVQVYPNGGFTFTEPDYGRGWNVTAQPNGQLTNHADGTQWPYLFWEGHGESNVPVETRGFVVKASEVESMLEDKLGQLGLNKQETADFNEFWVPKMQHYPYYFVTFYTNEFLDSLAPLKVNPQPDSIIRIMMDYKPLMRPIRVQELPIVTPERDGFTLVEWGGVLRK